MSRARKRMRDDASSSSAMAPKTRRLESAARPHRAAERSPLLARVRTWMAGKAGDQKAFSRSECERLVAEALREREEEVRREFYGELERRLEQQWQEFSVYNRDCVQRTYDDKFESYIM